MTEISMLKEIINDGEWMLVQHENLVLRDMGNMMLERAKYGVIEVATGVRRAGKSKLLLWIGRALKGMGKRVYYINFEDDRFLPEKEDFQKISSILYLKDAVLLIDEPQNMPGWELWVKRMHERGIKVYVTGSNSKLLGREIASALGGRKKQHEVFPFSFSEYLRAKGLEVMTYDQKIRVFEEYLQKGGYPYPTITGDYSILSEYRRDIMERDIVMRHNIRDTHELKNLIRYLMTHPGLYVSHRSIKGFIDISHVTLRKYLDYITEAYAVIPIEKYSHSQKEVMRNPKKYYPVDNGLLMKKDDLGRLLEACIIQHIRRVHEDIYYWKDARGREVDIYLPDIGLAIQVVYSLNPENIKREEKGLESSIKHLGARPLIVYLYKEEKTEYPSMNAVEFLENLRTIVSKKS